MLKCQFHTHAQGDGRHYIPYTPKQLINRAAKLGYDVLAITSHEKILFNKGLKKYAEKKGILLIPGVEHEIYKKHIVCLNTDSSIHKANTFEKLRKYKADHPECLIFAPHPFFPTEKPLKKYLVENPDIFDAIEYSFSYTKTHNPYNKRAVEFAKTHKKPVLATADCHFLNDLDIGFTYVNSKKDTQSIFTAIRQNKLKIKTQPTTYFHIFKFMVTQTIRDISKIFYKNR